MKNEISYSIFKTDWGFFGLLADDTGLLRTSLPSTTYDSAKNFLLRSFSKNANEKSIYPHLQKAVIDYYNGIYVDFNKLDITFNFENLTDFSKRILLACKAINIGKTITYGNLAARAGGAPGAARAVGSVMAANQWPLLIGCHRVIRADGVIGRFSGEGGSSTKKRMLQHEQVLISKGDKYDSHEKSRIGQRPGRDWPLFAGNKSGKHAVSFGPDRP